LFLRSKRAGGGLFSYRTHKNDPSSEANGYYPRFSGESLGANLGFFVGLKNMERLGSGEIKSKNLRLNWGFSYSRHNFL
jgi:hypothetical protein